jgi:hypothetical protein
METLLVGLISTLGTTGIIIVLLIFFWDKAELLISRLLKIIAGIGSIFKFAKKKSVQLNVQSRINISIKKLSKIVSELETEKIKIDWIEKDKKRKAFIDDGNAVIRLRKDDSNEQNFIHGTYLYVSTCLLFKVKNHLNPSQKETMDLYVTSNLLRYEKSSAVDFFMETYLRPSLESKNEKQNYYWKYQLIDEHGLYYPILLNELNFLGKKVFASVGKNELVQEFDEIINFLEKVSNRKIGDDYEDLEYTGINTKLLIVIIGKPEKVFDEPRYVDFILGVTRRNTINSIYAIGDLKNKEIINSICKKIDNGYCVEQCGEGKAIVNKKYGGTREINQYYILLRKYDIKLIL